MVDLVHLDSMVGMRLYYFHDLSVLPDPALDAILLLVKLPKEPVSQFDHDIGEREE